MTNSVRVAVPSDIPELVRLRGVTKTRLYATQSGAPIYRRAGFARERSPFEVMSLRPSERVRGPQTSV